jgi:RNA-directed DNA polymerase
MFKRCSQYAGKPETQTRCLLATIIAKLAFKQTDDELKLRFETLNSLSDPSLLLEVPAKSLAFYAYKNRAYKTFSIPKRRGGTPRTISAPANKLKMIQQKLNHVLRLIYRTRNVVHGFALGRSIVTNSAAHTKNRYVLNVDLKDFFTAINFGRVRGMLMASPYSVWGRQPPPLSPSSAHLTEAFPKVLRPRPC